MPHLSKSNGYSWRVAGCSVTKRTISNEMLKNALKALKPKKTPLLWKRHEMQGGNLYACIRKSKIPFWERVLWTHGTKIELFYHNYRNHVRRNDGEAYSPKETVPTIEFFVGNMIIWGCFSVEGVGKISVIYG